VNVGLETASGVPARPLLKSLKYLQEGGLLASAAPTLGVRFADAPVAPKQRRSTR
jgi:hypothetical protein